MQCVYARDYMIKGAELWTGALSDQPCQFRVIDGCLQSIELLGEASADHGNDVKVIDGHGKVLIPAGVDPQVHLRVPGQLEKETPASALASAVKGGFAAVLNMPNTNPTVDEPKVVVQAQAELAQAVEDTGVMVGLTGAMTRGLRGRYATDMSALVKAGVLALTDDGLGVVDDGIMALAFRTSAETGVPVLQHAEFPGHGGMIAAGPLQKQLGLKPYPASAEVDMVVRDLQLLREFSGARYHVLHVSSAETLKKIDQAKQDGLQVTCEVSPHHLLFSSDDLVAENTSFKMNPPIRGANDCQALRQALASGLIDFVATDHAPHESTGKGADYKTAFFGTTGLETSLNVLLTLRAQGELTSKRLVEVYAQKPSEFLGLNHFGRIEVDHCFRAVLVDPDMLVKIDEAYLASQSKNCCFIGQELNGHLVYTFLEQRCWEL